MAWERKHNKTWKPYKSSSSSQNFNEARTSFFDESCVVLTDLNPVVMANNSRAARSEFWIYNTGASCHITNSLDKFDKGTYTSIDDLCLINTASGPIRPRGKGTVTLQCVNSSGAIYPYKLKDVSYLPKCPINLFSGVRLYKSGGYAEKILTIQPSWIRIC